MRVGVVTVAALVAGCSFGGEAKDGADVQSPPAASTVAASRDGGAEVPPEPKSERVILDCSTQSMADFGDAFDDHRNLVVGPLVFVGAAVPVPEAVVRAYDGQKFPALVIAGRTVTVAIPVEFRETAGLAYGPFPDGRIRVGDAHDAITFISCDLEEAGSTSSSGQVTFWSGFVMTSKPICLPLDVYIRGRDAPRRVEISLGAHCPTA